MTQSMRSLQPWLAFAETAKRGNFAAASRDLGCTPSTLAKSVARLEKHLGVRLFHRTTRQVTLTDDGRRLFARSERVLAELEQLEEEASGARAEPRGTLRINMPVAFGRLVMMPVLAELARLHPKLSIDARFSDVYVDLVKEGIDVAIRTGPLRDSTLVARTFGSQTLLLCAAPSYLETAGTPASVEELARHTAVLFRVPSHGRDRPWQLRVNGRDVELLAQSRVRVDDGDASARVRGARLRNRAVAALHRRGGPRARRARRDLAARRGPRRCRSRPCMPSARMVPSRVRALLDLLERSASRLPAAPAVDSRASPRRAKPTPRRAPQRPRR